MTGASSLYDKIARALQTLRNAREKSFLNGPVDDISVLVINSQLGKAGYAPLPEDYEALLRQACGIMGPYLTLLSPGAMEMAGGGQQDLLEESNTFNRWNDDGEEKPLVLGRMSGGVIIIYNDGQYHVVDETSRDVFHSYANIADLITDTVTRLDKARRGTA